MTIRNTLAEVSVRLEEAVQALRDDAMTGQEIYEMYEMLAIQTLDSEAYDHEPGMLEAFLMSFLDRKREALGLS